MCILVVRYMKALKFEEEPAKLLVGHQVSSNELLALCCHIRGKAKEGGHDLGDDDGAQSGKLGFH